MWPEWSLGRRGVALSQEKQIGYCLSATAAARRGAAACQWSGVPGVGARCGNGLFSTYKSPKFYFSFTILVSFILFRYPDRIGLVNTYGTRYLRYGTYGTYGILRI